MTLNTTGTCCKCDRLRRLQWSDVDLTHDHQEDFIRCQFWSPWFSLLWNGVWCVYFTVSLFLDVFYYVKRDRYVWLTLCTNWGYLLTVLSTFTELGARVFIVFRRQQILQDQSTTILWCCKLQWVLHNTNNVTAIIITILFYSVHSAELSQAGVNKTILTSVYVVLNALIVSAVPVKVLHFYQPVFFVVVYTIFTTLFQVFHKSSEKLILDWARPVVTAVLTSSAVLILPIVIHLLFYVFFKVRLLVSTQCSVKKSRQDTALPQVTLHRDITATDVTLEENQGSEFVDIRPSVKDDMYVKLTVVSNGNAFEHYDSRLCKSETDLRDYRFKNGLYCDFAKSSPVMHHRSISAIFDDGTDVNIPPRSSSCRSSRIIVVKKFRSEKNVTDKEDIDDASSNVSSDYMSTYISEDLLAYL